MDGWKMDEWMDGDRWIYEWMDGRWMNGWMDDMNE